MRYAIPLAFAVLAVPAHATGGFECRPVGGAGPVVTIGLGHTPSARPFSVSLSEGGRPVPVELGQSWIDSRYLWLDLIDPNALRVEARLRAVFQPRMRGRPALGTLVRAGRTYPMRCLEA